MFSSSNMPAGSASAASSAMPITRTFRIPRLRSGMTSASALQSSRRKDRGRRQPSIGGSGVPNRDVESFSVIRLAAPVRRKDAAQEPTHRSPAFPDGAFRCPHSGVVRVDCNSNWRSSMSNESNHNAEAAGGPTSGLAPLGRGQRHTQPDSNSTTQWDAAGTRFRHPYIGPTYLNPVLPVLPGSGAVRRDNFGPCTENRVHHILEQKSEPHQVKN